ncbi:MAG TPA: hypothetical protein VLW53_20190 [Candidatus Eisenbacteria bacterium]|nr:hypothetical protein [Candidatus Eisenbacteria bacterium]
MRLANGAAALLAPRFLVRRLQVPRPQGAAVYVFRLFGIRTVLIGLELVLPSSDAHHGALRRGLLIHASDTTAAVLAGWRGQLPRRAAATTAAISLGNTLLAAVALATRQDAD